MSLLSKMAHQWAPSCSVPSLPGHSSAPEHRAARLGFQDPCDPRDCCHISGSGNTSRTSWKALSLQLASGAWAVGRMGQPAWG